MMQNYNKGGSDDINLLDYWRILRKYRKMTCAIVLSITTFAIIFSLLVAKSYKAEAVIMPIGKANGGGLVGLASQLGGLASLGGVGEQTPSQRLMALLKTRSLAEQVINENNLLPVLFKEVPADSSLAMERAVTSLRSSHVSFFDDRKNGTIMISAEFGEPKLAADVANWYIEGLQKLIDDNSFTVAKRNRVFIETQLADNKFNLLKAGKELNEFYKSGKVSNVESQIDVPLDEANSKFEIQNQQMTGLEQLRSQKEGIGLEQLRSQKEGIENKITVKGVPQQVYLQYLTLRRSLLTQINTLLTQQYEMAKIEEARDDLAFQVIDPARVPGTRSSPNRKQMVVMAFISSLFGGIIMAFFIEYMDKMKKKYNDNGDI